MYFNKKITILGGGGFIGQNLVTHLINKGYQDLTIFGKNRFIYPDLSLSAGKLSIINADFSDIEALTAAIEGADIVFHLIHSYFPIKANENVISDAEENIIGTIKLLQLCLKLKVKKIIFASSGGTIYGQRFNLPIKESTEANPICAYGISKVAIEKYLGFYKEYHGLNSIVLRLSNPFGPLQATYKKQGVISTFIQQLLANKPITVYGNGGIVRDYVYISDVSEAMEKAIGYEGNFSVFNVGSGIGHSLNQIISIIESISGLSFVKEYKPEQKADVAQNILDIQLAKQYLDWKPNKSLYQGIELLLDYYKNN